MIVIFLAVYATFIAALAFSRYEPSPWEAAWSSNIKSGRWLNSECQILAEKYHLDRARWSVWRAQVLKKQTVVNDRPTNLFSPDEVFSKMVSVDKLGRVVTEYIEPLVGILRDPLTICENLRNWTGQFEPLESWLQAKRFLLPAFPANNLFKRLILMDLGASLYGGWRGKLTASGAQWFVRTYARYNLSFDRILSFEAQNYTARAIFDSVDPDIIGRYAYYNVPVAADKNSRYNPWNVLKTVAEPDDFVIVKLDVDNSLIERALAQQLISDKHVGSLVDEFYYENHVNARVMNKLWKSAKDELTMSHAYALFENLRKVGIRAHSWP